jgi:hypothetical protein
VTVTEHRGRVFDYVPRLDERNRAYRVTAAAPDLADVSRFWTPSAVVLDQGREGACVGHGVTHEYGASPIRGQVSNALASEVYRAAQRIDEWEGEAYSGTSVRAGMLVGRERGWWAGFRWAFNLAELRAALEEGPVVIGVEWREDSYDAPGGILRTTGAVVGGHCVLVTGYTRHHRKIGAPAYRIRNSWSASWGHNGSAYVAPDDLDRILFQAGGEAAVPVGRRL